MGLFSFVKSAGARLFGGEAKAATPEALTRQLSEHGFDASKVAVAVEGDRVKLSGQALSQEEAEKIILALGNTVGVAEVDAAELAVVQEAPQATFYTVQKGDTLWEIAERHFGKGQGGKHKLIVAANTPPVTNPDLIQPGWVLRLPPAG